MKVGVAVRNRAVAPEKRSNFVKGVVVPMPTLTALAPVPPSTKALLSLTTAFAPIAVALVRPAELLSGPAPYPRAVLKLPAALLRSAA